MNIQNYLKLMLSMVFIVLITGCESTDNDTTTQTVVNGKVIDGYIYGADVCLDLDSNNLCTAFEPRSITEEDGSYEITITPEHKSDSGYAKANLIAYGGVDINTGKNFVGMLSSAFSESDALDLHITPLTTLVSAIIETNQISKVQAEQKLADVLGLKQKDIVSDSILEAIEGNVNVLSKALEIQKSVEIFTILSSFNFNGDVKGIYLAFATGMNSLDTNSSVIEILNNANKEMLGEQRAKLIHATTVLVENISSLISNLDITSSIQEQNIYAALNTIENVKQLFKEEAYDNMNGDFMNNYISSISSNVYRDINIFVPLEDLNRAILSNIIYDKDLLITDIQKQEILNEINNYEPITLNNLVVVLDSLVGDAEIAELKTDIENDISKNTTKVKLLNNYDPSVTAENVYMGEGIFNIEDIYWDGIETFIPTVFKLVDEIGESYEINTTTNLFDVVPSNLVKSQELKLIDGVWVLNTNLNAGLVFDGNGNLITTDNIMIGIDAYDVSNMPLKDISNLSIKYLNWEENLTKDVNFSNGAKYYEFLVSSKNYKPYYTLEFYDEVWNEDSNEYIYTGVNQNNENNITSLSQFIEIHKSGNNYLWFSGRNDFYIGYFTDDEKIDIYDGSLLTNINVTYEIITVEGVEILIIKAPQELRYWENEYEIYAVQDGVVRKGIYYEATSDKIFSRYNKTAILDIWASIKENLP